MISLKNSNPFPKRMFSSSNTIITVYGITPCASYERCLAQYGFKCPGRFQTSLNELGSKHGICFGNAHPPHIRIFDKPRTVEEEMNI